MGGRGAGTKSGGGGGIVSANLPFEVNAERVFKAYGLERQGGSLIYGKKPDPNTQRWINANKERLIHFKYKVDQENLQTAQRYKEISQNIGFKVTRERGREVVKIVEPKLDKSGLKWKIVSEEKTSIGGKSAKELYEQVVREYGTTRTIVSRKELGL